MKVVINGCYGGFGLSGQAIDWIKARPGKETWSGYGGEIERSDPDLVLCVEALGPAANGEFARLRVVEIPDGTDYSIEEYDGNEHIAESHRTWS